MKEITSTVMQILNAKYSLDELAALGPEQIRGEIERLRPADFDAPRVAELRTKLPECADMPDSILAAAVNGDARAKAVLERAVQRAHEPPRGLLAGVFEQETDGNE